MRDLVGLHEQRTLRDLRLLRQDEVRWLDAAGLAEAPEPAVVCGVWAAEAPEASRVLRQRQAAGATTILVPRFSAGSLGPVLGAPVAVEVVALEASTVTWHDGTSFAVPATTAIRANLPNGCWGRSEGHATVVAWRPHSQAGWTVLCTPTVAGRTLDADPTVQLALLEHILDEAARTTERRRLQEGPAVPAAATAEEFLAQRGELGALALLAWWAAPGPDLDEAALARLGVQLDADALRTLGEALPQLEPGEVEATLRAAGWGAHLRVLEQRPTEDA
jgi:hypothetical protein